MSIEGSAFNLRTINNLGSIEIGFSLSLVLFGVGIIQAYTYYQCFSNDRLFLKVLVTAVLMLELVHSCMTTYMVYDYTIILGGYTPDGPNSYPLSASSVPGALITALVQGFFAFRIYRLSGSLYISVICWLLSLLRLGGLLALIAEGLIDVPRVPNTITFTANFAWLLTLIFIIGAVVDVLVAASLCYYLKRMAPGEHLKNTSELIDRLMVWIIQTGMITSATSIAIVIGFYMRPHAEIWFSIYLVNTKLYSNSLFASLNVRHRIQNKRVTETTAGGLQFQDNLARLELSISGPQQTREATLDLTVPKKSLAFHSTRQSSRSTVLEEQQSLAGP